MTRTTSPVDKFRMNGISVRPAGWRDTPAVARLERECFADDAWPLIDVFFTLLWPGTLRLKAEQAGRLVGFVAVSLTGRGGEAWITTIGVLPEAQGWGIGSMLLRAVESTVDAARLRLTVRESNRPARSLYWKFGYRSVDVWRGYYQGGEDGVVMEKRLEVRDLRTETGDGSPTSNL